MWYALTVTASSPAGTTQCPVIDATDDAAMLCIFAGTSWSWAVGDDGREGPARKRTAVATNSEAVAAALERLQCDGAHKHVWLNAGRPRGCQAYPVDFCHLLCRAYAHQVALDRAEAQGGDIAGVAGAEVVDVSDIMAPLVASEIASYCRSSELGGSVLAVDYT